MMTNTICYKLKNPVYYNKGTKWEKTCDHFLAYETYKNDAEAQAEVERLNAEKPTRLWNGQKIDWNNTLYFYVNKQERMC